VLPATVLLLLASQAPGLPPQWDSRTQAEKIATDIVRLRPIVERLDPGRWISAGAPAAYQRQWTDCLGGIAAIQTAATNLAKQPDRLSVAVETLLDMERVAEHVTSLAQAVRRYQNPAIAEVVESELGNAMAGREWLRTHVKELVEAREKELATAESEAQRCRSQVLRPGARKP
jgi:hypothetical protein